MSGHLPVNQISSAECHCACHWTGPKSPSCSDCIERHRSEGVAEVNQVVKVLSHGCPCGRELLVNIFDRPQDSWRKRRAYFCAGCRRAPSNCLCVALSDGHVSSSEGTQ